MSEWTENQSKAIKALTGDVLVSASAGSGKTSVMIERLVKLVVEEGVSVDKILCLTFTRSASEEMKSRLKNALIDRLKTCDNAERERIIDNLDALPFAEVTTIDSFCSRLNKKYFESIDSEPNPTLATDSETKALKYSSAVKVLNDFGDSNDKVYYELLGFLGKKRGSESFIQLVLGLDSYLSSLPDADEYLQKATEYVSEINKNKIAKDLLKKFKTDARRIEAMTVPLLAWDLPYPELVRERMLKLNEKPSNGFLEINKYLVEPFPEKPKYNRKPYSSKKDSKESITRLYLAVKEFEDKYANLYIDTFSEDTDRAKVYVKKLIEVVSALNQEYQSALKAKNLTDFSTIAHEALKLLSIPEIRRDVRATYQHVLIDEYQDTNRLQEEIIESSGGGKSSFVVGDEKQSIYAFRHAEPEIFASRRKKKGVTVINLSDNFRQDAKIIEVVNGVFSSVMTESWAGIEYKKEPMVSGIKDAYWHDNPVEIYYVPNANQKSDPKPLAPVYSVREDTREESEDINYEALYVGEKIKRLVSSETIYDAKLKVTRPVSYKDIVIISRNRSKKVRRIADYLRSLSIPVGVKDKVGLPVSAEVLINYLRYIDNPTLDEPMLISMASDLFGFTPSELAEYKLVGQKLPTLNDTFRSIRGSYDKLDDFFTLTERYIEACGYTPVYDLLHKIVLDTDYLIKVDERGEDARVLLSFIESLGGESTARSVSEFLSHFDEYPEFTSEIDTGGGDAVRFMTMHGAKGLEYPIVFLVETGRTFSSKDDDYPVNYHKKWGIGIKTFFTKERIKRENFIYKAIKDRNKDEQAIEESRLLYVAMTRAKNRLFISGSLSQEAVSNTSVTAVNSHLGFIQVALNKDGALREKIVFATTPDIADDNSNEDSNISLDLSFAYPYDLATKTPVKYTVTGLLNHEPSENIVNISGGESAEKGTLYHKVMQYMPLDTKSDEVNKGIDKLVLDGIITEDESKIIDQDIIAKVLDLPIIKEVSQRECRQEQEFLLHTTHADIVDGGLREEVVLQGVIDLLVLGDKPIVIDYKFSGKNADNLLKTYRTQLNLYKKAVQDILGVGEVEVYLISLKNAECIKV